MSEQNLYQLIMSSYNLTPVMHIQGREPDARAKVKRKVAFTEEQSTSRDPEVRWAQSPPKDAHPEILKVEILKAEAAPRDFAWEEALPSFSQTPPVCLV